MYSAVGTKLSEEHDVTRFFPEDWGSRFLWYGYT